MAETIDELTYDYEDEGVLVRKQLDKVVLTKGSWSTLMFLYQELDKTAGTFRAPKIAIVRFKKFKGSYRKQSSFNVSSEKQARQITGVFGLVGAGRTETFKIVAGVLKRDFFHGGEVLLHDKPVRYRVPAPAVRAGIAYITEDRKVEGFFETTSIARNIYLGLLAKFPGGRFLMSRREAAKTGAEWIERLKVRAIGDETKVVELSGGNQQKVVIAKSLVQQPDLIIFDEPTRGVDVGAIVEIHELINRLADEGKAVVVISSYLPEILALSDRILVSRQGKVVEEFSALEATEEKIMYAAIH